MTRASSRRRPKRRPFHLRRRAVPSPVWLLSQATRLIPGFMLVTAVAATALGLAQGTAYAAGIDAVSLAADSIEQVANNIRNWLVGILVAVATLFLTVGGLRYLAAGGDPGEVEKAKLALRSAALGYGLAMLAPLFVTIVGKWVA